MLQLCDCHLIGLLAQTLVKATYHFSHLLVFIDKLSLLLFATLNHWLDIILMFNEVGLLGEIIETPVNSLDVLFSHKHR